mmetsp:Transcript_12031/g.24445  ORF Transcript_12031/g.24445 Transcript_12031/m.24445 type:complete len:215 (+) Transcript_12031:621-1265(+)
MQAADADEGLTNSCRRVNSPDVVGVPLVDPDLGGNVLQFIEHGHRLPLMGDLHLADESKSARYARAQPVDEGGARCCQEVATVRCEPPALTVGEGVCPRRLLEAPHVVLENLTGVVGQHVELVAEVGKALTEDSGWHLGCLHGLTSVQLVLPEVGPAIKAARFEDLILRTVQEEALCEAFPLVWVSCGDLEVQSRGLCSHLCHPCSEHESLATR